MPIPPLQREENCYSRPFDSNNLRKDPIKYVGYTKKNFYSFNSSFLRFPPAAIIRANRLSSLDSAYDTYIDTL